MHIGILKTGQTPPDMAADHPDYDALCAAMLDGHGFTFTAWPVVDGTLPDSPADADAWLITGSRHGAYDDLPWIPRLEEFIREAKTGNIPVTGVCFGHQIVAQALGGTVEKFPGGWSVGRTEYDFGEFGTLAVHAWHQDQVTRAPDGARTVATTPFCAHAGLLYGDWGFTVQPHPEFDAGFIQGLIDHRGPGNVPEDRLDIARESLTLPTDNAKLADLIAGFLKDRRLG